MNRCYRLIFNRALERWTVASELATGRGKSSTRTVSALRSSAPLACAVLASVILPAEALAACKQPWDWVNEGLLGMPGIKQMSRTPYAGYNINWVGDGKFVDRGWDAGKMPSAWLDHYCESNPATPAGQNLSVYSRANNGGDGHGGGVFNNGGNGGRGGDGSDIFVGLLSDTGRIATAGDGVFAMKAHSRGGNGGGGGHGGTISGNGGSGGLGGNGGVISILNAGALSTGGRNAPAMLAISEGGTGGWGGGGGWAPWSASGHGNKGGNSGSTATLINLGSILTTGLGSTGMYAASIGGNGGDGGVRVGSFGVAVGGNGGGGGQGGFAHMQNLGSVVTKGDYSDGVAVQSIGGGGGDGGWALAANVAASFAIGGDAGSGGGAGQVDVFNRGIINTSGKDSAGIRAQSIGGGGGDGGRSISVAAGVYVSAAASIGGKGGNGGDGALARVTNYADARIQTGNALAELYKSATRIEQLDPLASGYPSADRSYGIFAQSVGGGGGSGGSAISVSAAAGDSMAVSAAIAIGGSGGNGGNGRDATVDNRDNTSVTTYDRLSQAIFAQSVGGGGGSGGDTLSVAAAISPSSANGSLGVNLGGKGGKGGNGALVTVNTGAALTTWGTQSDAVLAQSIGGGGGNGGSVIDVGIGVGSSAYSLGVNLGGSGGSGGSGGNVAINSSMAIAKTNITTAGDGSKGIKAQSIGGGGGNGGAVKSYTISLQKGEGSAGAAAVNLGGNGGSGGTGGSVNVNYNGRLETLGHSAQGILAQSIGGGGGSGGNVFSLSLALSLNANNGGGSSGGGTFTGGVNLGGNGGSGNHAGAVNVNLGNDGRIVTHGVRSAGVMAQSIGGGGGEGGNTHSFSVASSLVSALSGKESTLYSLYSNASKLFGKKLEEGKKESGQTSVNLAFNLGGKGGAGGNGQQVWVGLSGSIATEKSQSYGVFAQSVGGGGGSGGSAFTNGAEGVGGYALGLSLGGAGNGGGSGGKVLVGMQSAPATISTLGESSHGILAQSVGGGGGEGGLAKAAFEDYTLTMSKISGTFSLGGSGGAAGNGDTVRVYNGANITTSGANANGIVAQSIGGGGGVAGSTGAPASLISLTMGGNGGGGGNGADVNVGNFGVSTAGDNAIGVVAQSIGGGGGMGGIGDVGGGMLQLSLGVGGKGGAAGNGGVVNVGCLGEYATAAGCARNVTTAGKVAHGILAQSIGGGGGLTQSTQLSLINVPRVDPSKTTINLGSFGRWKDSYNGNSGKVSVQDTSSSRFDIRTSGAGAIGLIAQSLSGGGGTLSLDKGSDLYSVNYTNGIQIEGNGTGTNGGVDLNLQGRIATTGIAAHGIYAQALAGSQTVFGADGAQVFGGTAVANGRIDMKTSGSANISVSGKGANAVVSMTNHATGSPAQWLQLGGQISATGEGAWAVKASNGFANAPKTSPDSIVAVDALGTIRGGKNSAGAVSVENYNGGTASFYVYPTGRVTMDRADSRTDCPASGCYAVSMVSNKRNQVVVQNGGIIGGGMVLMRAFEGAGNFMTIDGSIYGVAEPNGRGEYSFYHQPAIQATGGRTEITIGSTGQVYGAIDTPYLGGTINNNGRLTGRINAFDMDYTNNGLHVLQVPGSGGGGRIIDVASLNNTSKGQMVVELTSLPSPSFTPVELVQAKSTLNLGSGITSEGPATKLDIVQNGNKVMLNGARISFGMAGMPPDLEAAVDIADDQANSGGNGGLLGSAPKPSLLYDLLLDMANESDASVVSALLDNFALGYADAELTLAAAWYAANHLQSCGDNNLATTSVIEQGDCSWTKLTYDDMELGDGAQQGHSWGFNAGWQRQISDHFYVGMSGGYARTQFANNAIAQSEGDRLTLGGILKYVNGNVFGAASLVGGYSTADGQRAITVPGAEAVAKSDRETWLMSARVRGGYNFALQEGFAVTPSLEMNLPLIHDDGYRETGGGELNMQVLSSTNVVPDLYPALQLSKYFTAGKAGVRGWVELGKRVRMDDLEVDVKMPDGFAPDAISRVAFDPGKTSTLWSTGLLIEWSERLEARLVYENENGSRIDSQSGSFKFAWKL